MSNTTEGGNSWLASRLIFDASLVVGMLGFAASLWGVPGLRQLGLAVLTGVACAITSFVLLYSGHRLAHHALRKAHGDADAQSPNKPEKDGYEAKRIYGNPYAMYPDEESMSLNSLSEDERTVVSRFEPKMTPAFPTEWSVELIETLDWQVFDNLCVAFWKMKGNSVVNRSEGSVAGTRFVIAAATHNSARLGIVETRSAHSAAVSVAEMQKLLKRQKLNKLPLVVLMYAGKLSNVLASFCERNNIRAIGAANIYQGLSALTEKQQQQLLKTLIRPDYMIPTCPQL